jgi:hypothetical protein
MRNPRTVVMTVIDIVGSITFLVEEPEGGTLQQHATSRLFVIEPDLPLSSRHQV